METARVKTSTAPSIVVSCSRGTAFGESRKRIANADSRQRQAGRAADQRQHHAFR